jgi:hypothetical protein
MVRDVNMVSAITGVRCTVANKASLVHCTECKVTVCYASQVTALKALSQRTLQSYTVVLSAIGILLRAYYLGLTFKCLADQTSCLQYINILFLLMYRSSLT